MKAIPKSLLYQISGATVNCYKADGYWNVSLNPGDSFDFGILSNGYDLIFETDGAYFRDQSKHPVYIEQININNYSNFGLSSFFSAQIGIGSIWYQFKIA